jgi:hypothetical protein
MGLAPAKLAHAIGNPRDTPEILPSWTIIDSVMKAVCEGSLPIVGSETVFPSVTTEHNMISGFDETKAKIDRNSFQNGTDIILITGCLTYKTFDQIHHTGFCQYISKHRTGTWEFLTCPGGNYAN